MDFKKAAQLASCISKNYAEDMFRLLTTYQSISASEAASRVNLHVRTVQDFLEDLYEMDILAREEVYEGKRPYFRYNLKTERIIVDIDLNKYKQESDPTMQETGMKIREMKNSGARFTTSRSNDYISHVVIWKGDGRTRTERKINLSIPQGKFLFHLPFPTAPAESIEEIMLKAGLHGSHLPEIIDIVKALGDLGVIEQG
jgi:predicted transcriptional regulator